MKKIIISIAMLVASNGFSQMNETKKLVSGKGLCKWDITMEVKNNKDTLTYFYYGFQNQAYSYITDIGSIFFTKQNDLIDFANALKTLATKEKGVQLELNIKDYSVKVYDFSNNIYIEDEKGKYTYMSKNQAVKLSNDFLLNAKFLKNE
jgi:hypothetical protein